jgi:hypothetical protein
MFATTSEFRDAEQLRRDGSDSERRRAKTTDDEALSAFFGASPLAPAGTCAPGVVKADR